MRPLSLALGCIAFVAMGAKGDIGMSPIDMERLCREAEAEYSGPPMPIIAEPTFSGSACPSPGGRLAYNYVGMWSCMHEYDAQFVIPEVNLRAEDGDVVEAECAITFSVEDLGEGYQVAVDEGILDADVELSQGTEVRFNGAAGWEGGNHDVSTPVTA